MQVIPSPQAVWIWQYQPGGAKGRADRHEMLYFRKPFEVKVPGARLVLRVSADSRYRLFLNGQSLATGPCKGDLWRQYYDTVDLTPHLRQGRNVLAVQVAHYAAHQPHVGESGPVSSIRAGCSGGLLVDGVLTDPQGNVLEDLGSTDKWKVQAEEGIELHAPGFAGYAICCERVNAAKVERNWRNVDFDDTNWWTATQVANSGLTADPVANGGQVNGWYLIERPIPALEEVPARFSNMVRTTLGEPAKPQVEALLGGKGALTFPAGAKHSLELDAGELSNGFMQLVTRGGQGAKLRIFYAEAYGRQQPNGNFIKSRGAQAYEGRFRGLLR